MTPADSLFSDYPRGINTVTRISIARKLVVKHILTASNAQATVEELVFV
jgi:hypothetical protein